MDFAEDLGHLLLLRARILLLLAGIGAGYWIAVSYPSPLIFGSSLALLFLHIRFSVAHPSSYPLFNEPISDRSSLQFVKSCPTALFAV